LQSERGAARKERSKKEGKARKSEKEGQAAGKVSEGGWKTPSDLGLCAEMQIPEFASAFSTYSTFYLFSVFSRRIPAPLYAVKSFVKICLLCMKQSDMYEQPLWQLLRRFVLVIFRALGSIVLVITQILNQKLLFTAFSHYNWHKFLTIKMY